MADLDPNAVRRRRNVADRTPGDQRPSPTPRPFAGAAEVFAAGDEADYIRDYGRRYRWFPHESTDDQMFSEEQFEV
jgi:hypothetical protein